MSTGPAPQQGRFPGDRSEMSPGDLLALVRDVFAELGLLGRKLSLVVDGRAYRVCCDDSSFVVYRVNELGPRHHVPGWPVCLVNQDMIFEEFGHDALGNDHCSCGLALDRWLDIVGELCSADRLTDDAD